MPYPASSRLSCAYKPFKKREKDGCFFLLAYDKLKEIGEAPGYSGERCGEAVEKKVIVDIFGEPYPLKTDNDETYVRKLAAIVDTQMRNVAQNMNILSGTRIGVLAALQIADRYLQLKRDYEELLELINQKKLPNSPPPPF